MEFTECPKYYYLYTTKYQDTSYKGENLYTKERKIVSDCRSWKTNATGRLDARSDTESGKDSPHYGLSVVINKKRPEKRLKACHQSLNYFVQVAFFGNLHEHRILVHSEDHFTTTD